MWPATAYVFAVSSLLMPMVRASDFAVEVVDYDNTWSGTWSDPQVVLGRPTVDTVGDGRPGGPPPIPLALVPVYPAMHPSEVFKLGTDGESGFGFVVVRFDHPIEDDPLNPCGIDFIIFGNTFQEAGDDKFWQNGDPNLTFINSTRASSEPGLVSVSADGIHWQTFDQGPYADTFCPTLGRIYDEENPEPSLLGNLWWGAPTDPTYPLHPAIKPSDFVGMSVAQMARRYGYSAGGTGFDLSWLNPPMPAIQYIKVVCQFGQGTPEIDAFADVKARRFPDFDCDSDVDLDDVAFFEDCATGPGLGPPTRPCLRADLDGDGDVDQTDFGLLQQCFSGPNRLANLNCLTASGGQP